MFITFYHIQGGRGLHSTLNSHSRKFIGVLNGIDTDAWNPATDAFLKVQYSANDIQGKGENKEAIQRKLRLSSTDVRKPLVIIFAKAPNKWLSDARSSCHIIIRILV